MVPQPRDMVLQSKDMVPHPKDMPHRINIMLPELKWKLTAHQTVLPKSQGVLFKVMLLLPTNSLIHVIILKLAHLQYHQHRDTHSNLQIHSLVVVRTTTSQFFNFLFVENEKCLTI
jgi:hypothetical protein